MSILKRTVFYSSKGGQIKFLDWASTMTTLGACAEPFMMNDRGADNVTMADFDPSDMMAKVDEMHRVDDEDMTKRSLSSQEEPPLNGGNMSPRVLIFTGNN